jgi:predicted phage-related endonuclease
MCAAMNEKINKGKRQGIGASDASKIMNGDWVPLWEERTGRREPDDLSDILPVMMGLATERFHRDWYAKRTGRKVIPPRGVAIHLNNSYMRCSPDGFTSHENMPDIEGLLELKHVHPFTKPQTLMDRYYPQLQHQMEVCGMDFNVLSVLFGNSDWQNYLVKRDDPYIIEMMHMQSTFWSYVVADKRPPESEELPSVREQIKPTSGMIEDATKEYDMVDSNAWSHNANEWLVCKKAAESVKGYADALKELIPTDARRAFGRGVSITRSKAGKLTLKEIEEL